MLKAFPSFRPIPLIYEQDQDAPRLAEENEDSVEVLLASGPVPYNRIREGANVKAALHMVPLTDTGFYRALFRLKNTAGVDTKKVLRRSDRQQELISADWLTRNIEVTETNAAFFA